MTALRLGAVCSHAARHGGMSEFDQLTARELYLILRARSAVFVVEQWRVHLDADGRDETALHLFAAEDMSRQMPIVAYARVQPGDAADPDVVIDKILTSPGRRGDGTADALVERALQAVRQRWPGRAARVTAPATLRDFYEQFGFRKVDGPFVEQGTVYIGLRWQPRAANQGRFSAQRRARGGAARVTNYELP